MKDLCRDIYDLYAEYEDEEEEEDRLTASTSQLLLSPTKHLTLNINVGGTVILLNSLSKERNSYCTLNSCDICWQCVLQLEFIWHLL